MLKNILNKKSAYIIGGIFGVITTIIIMLLFSALILFLNIDREYSSVFATISLAVGCFVASLLTAKKIGDKGYLIGLTVGATVFVVITVLSLLLGNTLSLNTFFHLIIIILSSLVGGIIGVNYKKNKKYI